MLVITGGAGLIGSAVVWELNRRGREDILIVDHLGTGDKWRNLAPLRFLDYLEKDVFLDLLAADRFPWDTGRIEGIIHLGACSSTLERDATYLVKNNYDYSKRLFRFARKRKIRFIYASSAATYGDGNLGFSDDEILLPKLRPLTSYGWSKHLFDRWLQQNGFLDQAAGLKYFNVFGPNEQHKGEMRSVVLKAFEQIRETGAMTLFRSHHPGYADGEQARDFVYVKDAAAMTLFFLDHPEVNGIFNIGTGKARTWNDLARALFAALDLPPAITFLDMPKNLRACYQHYTRADIRKLLKAGYNEQPTSLEDAVNDYVQNYLLKGRLLGE